MSTQKLQQMQKKECSSSINASSTILYLCIDTTALKLLHWHYWRRRFTYAAHRVLFSSLRRNVFMFSLSFSQSLQGLLANAEYHLSTLRPVPPYFLNNFSVTTLIKREKVVLHALSPCVSVSCSETRQTHSLHETNAWLPFPIHRPHSRCFERNGTTNIEPNRSTHVYTSPQWPGWWRSNEKEVQRRRN